MPVFRFKLLIIATLVLTGCSQDAALERSAPAPAETKKTRVEQPPTKDLVTFRLPKAVTDIAPEMQAHLFTVLPYNTTRWQVKPEYVFLEGKSETKGTLTHLVTRLNLLHMAYYRGDQLVWSGSLMHARGRGQSLTAAAGYGINLKANIENLTLEFSDGDQTLSATFPVDQDAERTVTADGAKLYLNHYVFPQSLVSGKKEQK